MHGCVLVVTPARRRPVCRGELGACAVFPALTIGHAIAGNDEPARPAGGRVRGPVWRRAATRAGQGGSRDPPRGDDPSHDPRFDSRRRVAVVEAGQEAASGLPRGPGAGPPCPRGRVRCVDPPKCVSKHARSDRLPRYNVRERHIRTLRVSSSVVDIGHHHSRRQDAAINRAAS